MANDPAGGIDGPKALSMFGVAAAAVVGLTVQPMLAIADPVALLITGFLIVLVALGIAAMVVSGYLSPGESKFFEIVTVSALIAMALTIGDAWREQRGVRSTCAKLQHIMLYEHRHRKDVPDIFKTLGCKIQG